MAAISIALGNYVFASQLAAFRVLSVERLERLDFLEIRQLAEAFQRINSLD